MGAEFQGDKLQQRLEFVIEGSRLGTWEWNVQTNETVFNETWANLVGYTLGELTPYNYETWAGLLHPDDLPGAARSLAECLEGEAGDYECQFRMRHKNGGWVWILDRGRVMARDADGRPLLMFGTHTDITKQKQAEEEAREVSIRLVESVRAANVGLWDWELSSNRVYYSPEWKHQIGYEEDEIGDSFAEWSSRVHPDDLESTLERIERAIAGGQRHYHTEFRFRHRDGSYRWILAQSSVYRDEAGQAVRVLGSHIDVTERRQIEDRIRAREHYLYTILQTSADGFLVINPQGKILEVNDTYCACSGYDRAGILGMYIREIEAIETQAEVATRIARIMANGSEIFETRHRRKNGGTWPVEITSNWLEEEGGRIVCFCRDLTERKQREERISLLGEMLHLAPASITIHNTEGRFVFANRVTAVLHGYEDEEQFLKVNLHALDVPESEARLNERLRLIQEEGEARFEVAHYRKDGSSFPLEVLAKRIEWDGKPAVLSVATDITESKAVQEQRERQLAFLRALNRISEFIIAHEDADSILEFSNQVIGEALQVDRMLIYDVRFSEGTITAMCEWLRGESRAVAATKGQYTSLAMFGEAFGAIRDSRCYLESHAGAVNPLFARNGSDRILHGQLNIRSLIWYPFAFNDDGYYLFTINRILDDRGWSRDEIDFLESVANQVSIALMKSRMLQERQHAEEELARRENLLQRVFEILPIGLWFADREGNLLRGNPAGIAIWGAEPHVPPSEYGIFRAWRLPQHELVGAEDWALAKTIRDGVTVVDELLEIESFDGKRKTILNYTAPVLDDKGNVDGAIVVNLDISDRTALEAQLAQSQKMESIGRLAGGVAHDFNNMLNVILGHAEMAIKTLSAEDPLRAGLCEIQKAAQRSADLTRQLLGFARRQTVAPKVLDLNETVESMLNMLRRLIGEDIELAWNPCKKLEPVRIDPAQISQLLTNLCVNARDAIGHRVGRVTIETASVSVDERSAAHGGHAPGRYVVLTIRDSGCGMSEEVRAHIFEPFFTTKGVGEGTGLGLATVFGIIKQNQGYIDVDSTEGVGTTFRMYIPVFQFVEEKPARETQAAASAPGGGETILLVEDEHLILNMGRMMLEHLGYVVLTASTPGEAIGLAREYSGKIHLLVTDVVMPEMNGRELAETLCRFYPDIKRLFMSGYTADVIASQGVLDEGVNFIAKPFTLNSLGIRVREVLDA